MKPVAAKCRPCHQTALRAAWAYHQQITEGNIIPNIDRAWSEVAYMQIGDNPGRK